jgi:hypothetical protein
MKTPREVLLARHQAAGAKLDRIRSEVLAGLSRPPAREGSLPVAVLLTLWRELIWPCRRTWVGLTAVWMALVVFNVAQTESARPAVAKSATSPAETQMALLEQQRLLTELIGPSPQPSPAAPPRRPKNQPRSERRSVAMA